MTVLIVLLLFAGFVVLDLLVRAAAKRLQIRRERREREAALDTGLRLDVSHEAPSLKRVELPNARARVLAVDDEPVVLDALRKILTLDGFSVDTVENGREALGLVQRNDYDLVFTDLKMPGMTGVEVVRGVKHLRPDIDVAVITGYATIESAVETMRDGAADYVQKPFTPDELTAFARQLLLKRQTRLEAQRLPQVRLVALAMADTAAANEFCVPGGAFLSDGHAWARIESWGHVRIGLDDFARKALGRIDRVELPAKGTTVRRGEPIFTLHRGGTAVRVLAPLSGRVEEANGELLKHPDRIWQSPYDGGWVCLLDAADLTAELAALRIGKPVVDWYQAEITRLRQVGGPAEGDAPQTDWPTLEREFFAASRAA